MIQNMGNFDRILRLIAGPILFLLAILTVKSSFLAVIIAAFGVILVLTSFIGFCPAYLPFGLNTRKVREK